MAERRAWQPTPLAQMAAGAPPGTPQGVQLLQRPSSSSLRDEDAVMSEPVRALRIVPGHAPPAGYASPSVPLNFDAPSAPAAAPRTPVVAVEPSAPPAISPNDGANPSPYPSLSPLANEVC